MMDEKTRMSLEKKAKVFFDLGRGVHVKCRDGRFLNGHITEVSAEFFTMCDRKWGEIVIFFQEVRDIVSFIPDGK